MEILCLESYLAALFATHKGIALLHVQKITEVPVVLGKIFATQQLIMHKQNSNEHIRPLFYILKKPTAQFIFGWKK